MGVSPVNKTFNHSLFKPKYYLMQRYLSLIIIAILFSITAIMAQQPVKTYDYTTAWKKIEDFDKKGLPQSALTETNAVYKNAKAEKNPAQLVKAIIYILKFTDYKDEASMVKNLVRIENEARAAEFPVKPLLHSMLAEAYWHYYEENRYRFGERTQTANFKNDDISTWSLEKLVAEVIKNYRLSLNDAGRLQKIKIDIYDAVLTKGNAKGRNFRPTLYDFLAHRAADFFANDEASITKPSYSFTLNAPEYLSNAANFGTLNISSKDTLSFKLYALQILQDLIRFHLNDKNTEAFVDVDLKRLQFVYQNLTLPDKEELYLNSLEQLEKNYSSQPGSATVIYNIAKIWEQRGRLYQPLQSDDHKWELKKAFDQYQTAINRFPDSDGATLCYNAQHELLRKFVSARVEKVNVPGLPFRAQVNYKNFTGLYWRVVSVTRDEVRAERKKWQSNYKVNSEEKFLERFLPKTAIKSGKTTLLTDGDLQNHASEIKIDALPVGDYMILFSANPDFTIDKNNLGYAFTTISNLSFIERNTNDGSTELYVLDRTTGEPVNRANAQIFYKTYNAQTNRYTINQSGTYTSGEDGFIKIPFQQSDKLYRYNSFYVTVSRLNDQINSQDIDGYDYSSNGQIPQIPREKPNLLSHTLFFLDRAIYRPGQTLYFKGLYYSSDGKTPAIIPHKALTVTFYDVNSEVVATSEVSTNEYGTFNGTFTTPATGLTGEMYLQVDNLEDSRTYFSVEEYKRPKFEVKFDPIKGSFRLGDSIKAMGKAQAYSGANIDGAQVKYRVVRRARFPYWWWCWYGNYPSSPEVAITNGTTTTDAEGKFAVTFTALPDESIDPKSEPIFNYTVNADITDINGETHSNQADVAVAYKSLVIGAKVHNIDQSALDSLSPKFNLTTTNLAGEFEPARGNIAIWKLKSPAKAYRKRLWEQPDKQNLSREEFAQYFPNDLYADENNFYKWEKEQEVFRTPFDSQNDKYVLLKDAGNWATGKYRLEITSNDKSGKEVKDISYFEVNHTKTNKLAFAEIQKFDLQNTTCEPGETATIIAGSSEKIYGLFEAEYDGAVVDKRIVRLNNETQKIEIPILEKYRGNLALHYIFIKDNRVYSQTKTIEVPFTNKQLDIKFGTFRNKLQPGAQEQWKLNISGKNKDKVLAEMVASLYDASLDAFKPHNWVANLYHTIPSYLNWDAPNDFKAIHFNHNEKNWNFYKFKRYDGPKYDRLNWFESGINAYSIAAINEDVIMEDANAVPPEVEMVLHNRPVGMALKSTKIKSNLGFFSSVVKKDEEIMEDSITSNSENTASTKPTFSDVKIRKNFNETAFFYPNLQTNENGEIIINFTIPEALTCWKMLGFAHTKDLQTGLVTNELVTQKDLMVVPNQPRFFRENDRMKFAAKITSLTDSALNGEARLEFFDALTMNPINGAMKNRDSLKAFHMNARQSTNIEWDIEIPEGTQAITYRIVAKAGNFSDGEEMTLPVITDRMLVTETLPLPIHGKQTKTFTLDKLVNNTSTTLKNQRYTLEFTSNPAWYAVQALPYLMEYPYECTEQTFSRFYANSIASHIANTNPKIKRVFDLWSTIQPDALLSNLEKNQELKTALLEETPWVLNAKSENQRKHNVALLFDLNRMASEQEQALTKIQKAQTGNGGFSWFPGLPEDRYITQHIVAGLGHLDFMGVKSIRSDANAWEMTKKAIAYTDQRMDETYQYLKAEAKKGHLKIDDNHLGYTEIHYLYTRSYFKDVEIQSSYKEALDYFLGQAKRYWLQNNIYMQGMTALALQRNGDKITPPAIIKSLRERALNSEEMGMYWKNERGYFWYQAPIETQALMIEVFDEVANDNQAVEDLKTWLLKQKQTQDWGTTKATSEACYALLRRGTDVLASDNQVEIKVGNETIDPSRRPDIKTEAGTGYFKTAWTAAEITPAMGKIKVSKTDNGVAWGAVYWQYFEQLDKITPAETPLKLKKQLFLQQTTDRGPVIKPITNTTSLKAGDLVKVRIELRSDRDMEYIHLKDMRAAGFEPVETLSTYKYQDGLYYYESPRDVATNFFIGWLPKGTFVFEYALRVSQKGNFSNGVTTIQCMYAPEFSSHSEGERVTIK
jgi:uncharacterized protein YfaS (alpha-2-macroglobulin family)